MAEPIIMSEIEEEPQVKTQDREIQVTTAIEPIVEITNDITNNTNNIDDETYYEQIINYICSFTYPYSLYVKSLDIYHRYLSYNLDANMSQITKHIYIGNLSAAYHQGFIKDNYIEYMITAIWDIPTINESLTSLNVNIIDVPNNDIKKHFMITNTFIETAISANKNILIHCVCGVSRSVTIVVAYLIKKLGITPKDAIDFIKSRRSVANPNKGFLLQLEEYYNMVIENNDPNEPILRGYSSKELYNLAFSDL